MKKIYFLILLIFNITVCKSQVGINTATPDASSALDIESTDGGILIPRMTTSQKTAIVDPANSLMLYDTDLKQYQYFLNLMSFLYIQGFPTNWWPSRRPKTTTS